MRTQRRQFAALLALLSLTISSAVWGEVVGKTVQPLDGKLARLSEATLGDLAADGVRAALGADIAFVQASQIRPVLLPTGDLTREALQEALLFPDERVVLVEMSGAKVLDALERGLALLNRPTTSFLQVSGITVSYRSSAGPGRRVEEARVGNALLATDKTYRVAMPNSLAKGIMGYYRVLADLRIVKTGPSLSDALITYVRSNPGINIMAGQRLRDLSRSDPGGGKQ